MSWLQVFPSLNGLAVAGTALFTFWHIRLAAPCSTTFPQSTFRKKKCEISHALEVLQVGLAKSCRRGIIVVAKSYVRLSSLEDTLTGLCGWDRRLGCPKLAGKMGAPPRPTCLSDVYFVKCCRTSRLARLPASSSLDSESV